MNGMITNPVNPVILSNAAPSPVIFMKISGLLEFATAQLQKKQRKHFISITTN